MSARGRGGAVSREALLLLSVILLVVGACVGGWRLFLALRQLQAQYVVVERRDVAGQQRMRELRQQYEELSRQYDQLTVDRDNLFAQAKRAIQDTEQAQAERNLLENVFRQTDLQRLELLNRLKTLEERLTGLKDQQDAWLSERQVLEQRLAKTTDRSQEKILTQQLKQVRRKHVELRRTLRDTQREFRHTARNEEKASANLMRLGHRLETLQGEYTDAVSENASLRRQMDRLPKNVTGIAREHQRLTKDLADTHYNMGVMFSQQKSYRRAEAEFLKVIELSPDDAESHYNLGVIYAEHLPDREKAIAFFRKYLVLNPRGQSANWAKEYVATWQAWEGKERLD